VFADGFIVYLDPNNRRQILPISFVIILMNMHIFKLYQDSQCSFTLKQFEQLAMAVVFLTGVSVKFANLVKNLGASFHASLNDMSLTHRCKLNHFIVQL